MKNKYKNDKNKDRKKIFLFSIKRKTENIGKILPIKASKKKDTFDI